MRKIYSVCLAVIAMVSCVKETKVTPSQIVLDADALNILSGQTPLLDAEGGSYDITVNAEGFVIAAAERPWLNVGVNANVVTVSAGINNSLNSRYSDLTIIADDKTCTLTVQQMGKRSIFAPCDAWTISADVAADYSVTVDVTVADGSDEGKFYITVLPEATVQNSGAEDDISMFLSLNNNASVYRKGKTMHDATVQESYGVMSRGRYYVIVVGINGDEPDYKYAVAKFGVYYPYDYWLGTWNAVTSDGSQSRWTIKQKEQDSSYILTGLGGTSYEIAASFDSIGGALSIKTQTKVGSATHDGKPYDVDLYATKGGSGTIDWAENALLITAQLGEDKRSATVKAAGSFTGFVFLHSIDGSPEYYDGARDNAIPVTMTKVSD